MRKPLFVTLAAVALAAGIFFGPTLAFHLRSPAQTGEAARLIAAARIAPGTTVAEIGAGSGALASEVARATGATGRVYVSEIDEAKRARLVQRFAQEGFQHVSVVEALADATNLPAGCCDVVYLRNVLHHIARWDAYAAGIVRALKPGGRVAILDFAPGAMWHLAEDHGAAPERVIEMFQRAGLRLETRVDDWGGGMYALIFEAPAARPGPKR
jgi:ubiquinone/menaquinone biosynthesis C-methylase UbiE